LNTNKGKKAKKWSKKVTLCSFFYLLRRLEDAFYDANAFFYLLLTNSGQAVKKNNKMLPNDFRSKPEMLRNCLKYGFEVANIRFMTIA
jgi:hypothetical protein